MREPRPDFLPCNSQVKSIFFCFLHVRVCVCACVCVRVRVVQFGIIRDVMQNHLLQMLSIVAMESPISLSAEDVRDEKVRLLRTIAPITVADTVIGQYTADPKGREPGYLEDKDVPADSVTPTFATCVLHINNTRWQGIPFIMKSGKALDEKKADIRIQFKHPVNTLFSDVSPNELVLRVGPDEAIYLKMTTKQPGLDGGNRSDKHSTLTTRNTQNRAQPHAPCTFESAGSTLAATLLATGASFSHIFLSLLSFGQPHRA